MTLDDEPKKFVKTSIQIEEVDESWALKLLNESEQEDYLMSVQDDANNARFRQKELSLIGEHSPLITKPFCQDTSFITVNNTSDIHDAPSLSAIEYQILEQKSKLHEQLKQNSRVVTKSKLSFSRIKAFFVA